MHSLLRKRQRKPRLKTVLDQAKKAGVSSVTVDELQIIDDLAKPLEARLREPYLRAVALELHRYKPEQIKRGLIARIARDLQREFLRYPSLVIHGGD